MIYSTYDPVTGQILSTIYDSSDSQIPDNSILGIYNDQSHYIDITNKIAIAKPIQPSDNHIWNFENKTWLLDTNKLSRSLRISRNKLLKLIDQVNPIWYASLTVEQQTELAAYRTALLNVPQQTGFPTTVDWPIKPTWL